jgi:tetratricopeptide (TPR) repeat protein
VQKKSGDFSAAVASLTHAQELYRDLGFRQGEAWATRELGESQHGAGNFHAAKTALSRALDLIRDVGDRPGEAETLNSLGDLLFSATDIAEALIHYQDALVLATETSAQLQEARALEGIGYCNLYNNRRTEGAAPLRQALAIYLHIGSPDAKRLQTALAEQGL